MKFGVSLQTTTPLPSTSSPKRFMNSSTSGSVPVCGMTSSSFSQRGGLKKCVPRKCPWNACPLPSTIAPIGKPEVLLETIVFSRRIASMRSNRERLISSFSMTTSMIQSASASLSKSSSRLPRVISRVDS